VTMKLEVEVDETGWCLCRSLFSAAFEGRMRHQRAEGRKLRSSQSATFEYRHRSGKINEPRGSRYTLRVVMMSSINVSTHLYLSRVVHPEYS